MEHQHRRCQSLQLMKTQSWLYAPGNERWHSLLQKTGVCPGLEFGLGSKVERANDCGETLCLLFVLALWEFGLLKVYF